MISISDKVFENHIDRKINNNEEVYYSKDVKEDSDSDKSVYQKINDIFTSRNYVYKADVIIKTKNDTLNRTIIGRNKSYLITMTNELIPVSDIIDIYKEKGSSN